MPGMRATLALSAPFRPHTLVPVVPHLTVIVRFTLLTDCQSTSRRRRSSGCCWLSLPQCQNLPLL
jgi:hypothetical protein